MDGPGRANERLRSVLGNRHSTAYACATSFQRPSQRANCMPRVIEAPTRIHAHGQPPKVIEEYVGRASSGTPAVSVARMISPPGWSEPGQTPEFAEYTVVLRGVLHVESRDGAYDVAAGQAVIVESGEWV